MHNTTIIIAKCRINYLGIPVNDTTPRMISDESAIGHIAIAINGTTLISVTIIIYKTRINQCAITINDTTVFLCNIVNKCTIDYGTITINGTTFFGMIVNKCTIDYGTITINGTVLK